MKEVEVVRLEQLYASPKHLAELYDLGMTCTRALIDEMRASKKWRPSVIAYDRMVRVNIADFEAFWRTKSVV
ncbi:hypothetical protein [Megasphaera massiliensis]|uniref:hypothetical protein n=1 Tax=Megasphaera massiliensis TaxID=1232428 RepID=UPI00041E1B08|nr:hypothetical protein [Megasphaera massiliensis]